MGSFSQLRPVVRLYVIFVVLVGAATVLQALHTLVIHPIGTQWLVLAALTILTGSFSVKVPSISAYLSVSETFVFTSVLLFGPAAGTVTVLLEILVILFWMKPQARPIHRIFFNLAAPAIAISFAAQVFFTVSGIQPYSRQPTPLSTLFSPLLGFTALYFLLNSWLVAVAVGLEDRTPPVRIWLKNFAWLSVNYFSGASVAAVLVTYARELNVSTLAVIVPLLVVSYLTFRTAMGRVEDSNAHLSELNRLYLSTIETLAMAIDAKDQITHGHIRRVQAYAVGLAERLGVVDKQLLKAIEAAALLHDMGKLAVPEYILNKPGKLTQAEFAKMKVHATVGAEILSAIAFPYPVVPIVRHHHENWDGTGYPVGLKGTDIPIGARILSVVDCFDALTSDRPYRQRLADEEAIRILAERRGSMYDPLIVDTFIRVHKGIAPDHTQATAARHVLTEITGSIRPSTQVTLPNGRLHDIAASGNEMLALIELLGSLTRLRTVTEAGDVIVRHLRRLIPFSQSVLLLYRVDRDELVAEHAEGDASGSLKGVRFPLGQRLSGWVAANRRTIVNSDPALDLGDVARSITPPLQSCLSTPILCENELIGVLTLYSGGANAFEDTHRRLIEIVALQSGGVLRALVAQERDRHGDSGATTAHVRRRSGIPPALGGNGGKGAKLVLIEAVAAGDLRGEYDVAMRRVGAAVRDSVRENDVSFRYKQNGLAVVLHDVDEDTVQTVALRIQESVRARPLVLSGGALVALDVVVTGVAEPIADQPECESGVQPTLGRSVSRDDSVIH